MLRFSIIITCYNQSLFIRDAVSSALAQDCTDKEIIVVDDGSTDGSKKVLEGYGDAIQLKALETNGGAPAARNWGASLASGDYLVFLDGDDLLLPWALNTYGRIIDLKNPKLILGSMLWFKDAFPSVNIGMNPSEISVVNYDAFLKKDRACRLSASALVIDRLSLNSVGGWTNGSFPADDHDLSIKLGYSGRYIQIVAPQTIAYRVHANNAVHQIERVIDSLNKLIRREALGQYPGGRACRFERRAVIGGLIFFWFKSAVKAKLYGEAFKLLAVGCPMIFAAIFRRCIAVLRGRHPIETLTIG